MNWIVLFPGMTADAPVYSNEAAARAMLERTQLETAGNVEAVAMPLDVAVAAPRLLAALQSVVPILECCAAEAAPQNSVLDQRRDELRALLRAIGEAS